MGLLRTAANKIINYDNPNAFATKLRAKRIAHLLGIINAVHARYGRVDIIDIGGRKRYWKILPADILARQNITITILNLPGMESPVDETHFKFKAGDGCNLSEYEDHAFHIAHSNSVIEHVGGWRRMVDFARESRRVAPYYYVQTPNFWFPVEPHFMFPFIHWLPISTRTALTMRFNIGVKNRCETVDDAMNLVESAQLLDKKMLAYLFPDADMIVERLFLAPKSLIAIKRPGDVGHRQPQT